MTKLLIGVLSLALVGAGGLVAAVGGFDAEPARGLSVPAATTDDTTTGTTVGTTTERTTTLETTTAATTTTDGGVDISGPCDEAEHANDPRCTGTGTDADDNSGPGSGDDDNSGPGGGDDDRDDGDDEDRSGSNSGRG